MKCPHCEQDVKYRERSGRKCSKCGREFALDPRDHPLRLHDLRMRRIADALSADGTLRYNAAQLWYAAARKHLTSWDGRGSVSWGCLAFALALIVAILAITGAIGDGGWVVGLVLSAVVAIASLSALPTRRVGVPMPLEEFRRETLARWWRVYSTPPAGLVEGVIEEPAAHPRPRAALLCHDLSVLDCLRANRVPLSHELALSDRPDRIPPEVPVLVLHDAGPDGLLYGARIREALPGRRIIDLGLRPRTVMRAKGVLRLRDRKPDKQLMDRLGGLGTLTQDELQWLALGGRTPIASIPPKRLISVIEQAAARAENIADPDQGRARRVGFLTWPST